MKIYESEREKKRYRKRREKRQREPIRKVTEILFVIVNPLKTRREKMRDKWGERERRREEKNT